MSAAVELTWKHQSVDANLMRLHITLAGLAAVHGLGLVTPYAGLGLADEGAQSWRIGTRWQMSAYGSVILEGTRYEPASDHGAAHGLMLRGALRW